MKRAVRFLAVLACLLLSAHAASSQPSPPAGAPQPAAAARRLADWLDPAWPIRRPIVITGSTAGALAGYQLRVTVPYEPAMQADFDDIRFTSSDGTTLLSYWLEAKTDSTTADFWVAIPAIPPSPSTTLVYLYYGNAAATSASNGVATFDYLGDYESSPVVLRFITASDGHYGEKGTSYVTNFENIVAWLNAEKAARRLDYVFFIGDNEHQIPSSLGTVKGYYDQLLAPYRVVNGNHDRATSDQWLSTWGYSENADFEDGDYAFVLANTSNMTGAYLCADTTWLSGRLDHYASKRYVFVFMHVTPKNWTAGGVDCPAVRAAIGAHPNVLAVFQGHDHETDGTNFSDNTSYAWDGRFGGSFGVKYEGYRVVEVHQDGSVYTYQYKPATSAIVNSNRLEFSKGFAYPATTAEIIGDSTDTAKHGSQSLKLSGAEASYGVFVKKAIPEGKYVLESWVSSTIAGATQAVGIGLVSATAADPREATGNYLQSFLDYPGNLVFTDVVTDSVRDRVSYHHTLAGNTWYKSTITLDGANASFYSPSGALLRTVSYNPAKLFPAFPEFRHEGPAVGYFDLYTIRKYANPEPTYAIRPAIIGSGTIVASGGTPQIATVNTQFAQPLRVTVTDAAGNPIPGAIVTYSAPGTGASASLSDGGSATTNSEGHASVIATANGLVSGPYEVAAATGTLAPAVFHLTNQGSPIPLLDGRGLLLLAILLLATGIGVLRRP